MLVVIIKLIKYILCSWSGLLRVHTREENIPEDEYFRWSGIKNCPGMECRDWYEFDTIQFLGCSHLQFCLLAVCRNGGKGLGERVTCRTVLRFFVPLTCLPVLCHITVHISGLPCFCMWSKTGGGDSLGMRLDSIIACSVVITNSLQIE